jgi:hypothetical protein
MRGLLPHSPVLAIKEGGVLLLAFLTSLSTENPVPS